MNLLIFTVGDKRFAIKIEEVSEVIRAGEVTVIPESADSVEGVISLRGRVVTLVSMRQKLGLERKGLTWSSRVIIVPLNGGIVGFVVDGVPDVFKVKTESVEPPDEVLSDVECLCGVAKIQGGLIPIIDVTKLLTKDDRASIQKVRKMVTISGTSSKKDPARKKSRK